MTEIAQWGNLSPKLLHDLETHNHNIAISYNDNMDLEEIRISLKIPYNDWLPMEDVIFPEESIYKATDIFEQTKFYISNNRSGRSREVKNGIPERY